MRRRRALLASVLLATVSLSASVEAQIPTTERDERAARRDVALYVSGPADEARLLEDTLRELLGRLSLTVVSGGPNGPSTLARVDVDLTAAGDVRIVVANGRDGVVVAQRSIPRDASASVVREEIAHAIRAAVESELLVDDTHPPAPPPPSPPPPSPPVATVAPPSPPPDEHEAPRAPAGYGVDVGTFVSGGPFADAKAFVPRFGLAGSFGSRRGLRPALTLALEYALPFETTGDIVGSHTNLVAPRALATLEVVHASWIAVDVGAGGGLDIMSVEPRSAVLPSSTLGPTTTRADPVLRAAVVARIPLVPSVVFTASVAADGDLTERAYVADDGGRRTEVLIPWRVRPQLALGFAFTALGEATFR